MYRKLLDYFSHNKYRLIMFFLLAGATIFSVAIWRVRSEFSGTTHYAFLIWNLFLAWIPFIIAYFTYTVSIHRKWIYVVIPIAAFFWLIGAPVVLLLAGFVVGSGIYIYSYLRDMDGLPPFKALMTALLFSVCLYLVFDVLLTQPLYRGFLWDL